MTNKKRTTKSKKNNTKNIVSSFVILSSSATTDTKALKQSIARKQKQNKVSQLFDHSLPHSISFHGILKSQNINSKANVGTHSNKKLSPFILELKENISAPQQLIEQDDYNKIQLNFLCDELTHNSNKDQEVSLAKDLLLSAHEANYQIQNNKSNSSVKLNRLDAKPIISSIKFSVPQSISSNLSSISIDEFEPKELPVNFEDFFDLPEEEEKEDLVEEENLVLLKQFLNQEEVFEESGEDGSSSAEDDSVSWFPKLSVSISLPQGWHKAIGAFVAVSFIFVLPIHAMNIFDKLREVKTDSESLGLSAITSLKTGADATLTKDSKGALNSFTQAVLEFNKAENSIENLGTATSLVLSALPQTGKNYKTAEALVSAGKSLSLAGERISEGLLAIEQNINPTPASNLKILEIYLKSAYPHLLNANESLKKVNLDVVPSNQQVTLKELQLRLPTLISSANEFLTLFETIQTVLGANGSKRYLLVFQNNTEIRPTGGFMGSFAELKVHNGVIEKLTVPGGGTYDLQGWLKDPLVAPGPLQLLKARWEFQDANWFPDFPSSARQILQFYKNAGGPDVDGVVAINATYVSDLIGLLGPIDMPEYGRIIDQENFLFEAQKIVELEYDKKENKPKAFIGDLAPKLIEKATQGSPEDFLVLLDKTNKGLQEKDIQLYFSHQETQKVVVEKGWAGKIKQTDGDYLMVVNTNLGGGKTDGVISEKINVDVNVSSQGTITNTVTINRTHNGIKGVQFTGRNNVNYVRLYVPKGSELISASGFNIPDSSLFEIPEENWADDDDIKFASDTLYIDDNTKTEIFEEEGKTVFGNWIQTSPGTTSTTTFTYRLPLTISLLESEESITKKIKDFIGFAKTDKYTLTIQKQSGIIDRETNLTVNLPENVKTIWRSQNGESSSFTNKTDGFFALLLEQ